MTQRGKLLLTALTVTAAFAALLVGAVGRSSATVPANFIQGSATLKLEGCSQDGTIVLPNGSGKFVCPDSAYTTGNLAKLWNELDIVPFRLTTTTHGGDPTDYNVIVAGDYQLNGATGWDVVGDPVVNAGKSDASCTVSANAQDVGPGITGGADNSIYRVLTIHQAAGTTCVFDYYMRLALGASGYSGSSLQAYVFSSSDFNGGKKTVPLPVGKVLPQGLTKDMAATSSGTQAWNISKSPSPASIHFGDICSANFPNTQPLAVTVTWAKAGITPSGQVELITHVYATNPSARTITVTPTDKMYEGSTTTTQVGSTTVGSPVDVPANTTMTILTDDQTVSSTATSFNDVATATYIDKATQVPVPGSTQATASATVNSSTLGQSATATDSESITGSGLSFAVATPLFGAFTGGYVHDTYTTGPVGWTSGTNTITSNGSVVFHKTIKLDPAQVTSGSITDTAHITPSDNGSTVDSAPLTVNIDSTATSTLTINKDLSQSVSSDQTFHFDLLQGQTTVKSNIPVKVTAGHTSGSAQVTGLAPGSYTVHEDTPPTGWSIGDDQTVDLSGCSNSVTFTDNLAPATAFANKVTDPTGYQQGWTFTLTLPDGVTTLTGTTDTNGHVIWSGGSGTQASLGTEGTYTISETHQNNWTETGAQDAGGTQSVSIVGTGSTAHCSFTVTYPADAGQTYGCEIDNQSRAHVHVNKSFEGQPLTGAESFTFQLRSGSSAASAGTIRESEDANVADSGVATFAYDLIPGQTYAICEVLQANINTDLTGYNPGGNTGVVCQDFTPTPGQSVEFNVNNTPVAASARVRKVTDPAGYESGWVMTLKGPGAGANGESKTTTGTGYVSFSTALQDGASYTITETSQTGWTQTDASTECSFTVHYPADANRVFSCTISNQSRAHVHVNKSFEGQPLAGLESFTFQLRSGSSAASAGTILESEDANVGDSGVATFTYDLIPGQTYAICEVLQANINSDLTGYHPGGATGVICQDFIPTPGQSVAFNVNNTPVPAHAKAVKITVPSGHQAGWTMNLKSGGNVIESGVTASNGTVSFTTDLLDNTSYTIEETSQTGWDQTSATGDCSFTVHYPADANKTFTCTITNTEEGSITVKKVTNPSPDPSSSSFSFTGDVSGSIGNGQTLTTSNLAPGTYTSVEGALTGTGWTLQSISCDDGSSATVSTGSVATRTATFKLDPGEHVTCTFTNISRARVRVVKTLNGAPLTASSQDFQFELRAGDQSQSTSAALQTLHTNVGPNYGTLNFTVDLIPGQTYAICELLVVGFGPNFPSGYGAYNPGGIQANTYLCFNFVPTVANAANSPIVFNVDNSHATAKGLTIGFWKNHADPICKKSHGRQTDVLGAYLDGIVLGLVTFRDPFVSGTGNADECAAVQILSKNNFNGVHEPSDPLFNMAAQLLGADLNLNTGDTPDAAAASAISQAQALLVKYHWNGISYSPALTAADAALANFLNSQLDKFNNNNL